MNTSITVPNSVYVNGQWATAHWMADVVESSTGELVITATLAGEAGSAPVVTALRMDMALARELRALAGFGGTMAVDEADGSDDGPCYDCRTTTDRLDSLEQAVNGMMSDLAVYRKRLADQLRAIERRIEEAEADHSRLQSRVMALETEQRLASRTVHASLNEIERRLEVLKAEVANESEADHRLFGIYDTLALREQAKGGA